MPELYQELINLSNSAMYPFHMPGHKRNLESTPMKGAFRCDITEIDNFDNLHDENGIILEAEERANRIYGADKTFFLVNGSTSGVLSAVSAAVPEGGRILAARGSHRSLYHAIYLRHISVKYLPYKINAVYQMPEPYTKEDIANALDDSIDAVFITSPTYDGRCSDVRGIAEVCHERGIPLIVDAAHGAHFGFEGSNKTREGYVYTKLPESAVKQGADIVIHSVHKTLPSMTQTALLHIKGNLIDVSRVKRFLRIYQTSSPSYVLMSSIDLCMKEMEENGKAFVDRLLEFRNRIQIETRQCRNLRVLSGDTIDDVAKVAIYVKDATMTGQRLYDILREEYNLQLEMAGEKYALAIISGWDKEEGITRLIEAIIDIDKKDEWWASAISADYKEKDDTKVTIYDLPEAMMSVNAAMDAEKSLVPIKEATNHIAGEFINLYPPGIPVVVPGEIISEKIIEEISGYLSKGMNVQGITEGKEFICVKQK